jgi:hypothetical protein
MKAALYWLAAAMALSVSLFPAHAIDETLGQESDELDPYAPEAVRCERRAVTGSRVRRVRICMTNAEWADLRDSGNRDAGNLVDSGSIAGCRSPGVGPNGC